MSAKITLTLDEKRPEALGLANFGRGELLNTFLQVVETDGGGKGGVPPHVFRGLVGRVSHVPADGRRWGIPAAAAQLLPRWVIVDRMRGEL